MATISARYNDQGFVTPLEAFSVEQSLHYRNALEAAERKYRLDQTFHKLIFGGANFAMPFVDEITRLPSLLNPIREVLGPDLLVWGSGFFNKEPHTSDFVSWHQDLNYWGLSDVQEVTAWVALSDVTEASGCMRFIPGSHKNGSVPHKDSFAGDNLLSRGQRLDVEISEEQAVHIELNPGQFSMHHGRMFHASGPNHSDVRRIGLAIRYITPAMHQTSGEKPYVHLVSGEDTTGNFQLMPPATGIMDMEHVRAYLYNQKVQHQDFFANTTESGKQAVSPPPINNLTK